MHWFHTNLRQHSTKLFWILFIIVGILLIAGTLARLYIAEILAGLLLIALGLHKLDLELRHTHLEARSHKLDTDIRQIHDWLGESHNYVRFLKNQHESRIHKLDQKRGAADAKIEQNYRDLVRKILELENRMNEISRISRDLARIKTAKRDLLKKAPKKKPRTKNKAYKGRR